MIRRYLLAAALIVPLAPAIAVAQSAFPDPAVPGSGYQIPEVHTRAQPLESVVMRFAGDSGDGIQLTGGQFTLSTALAGNALATFPDFPAEIRAPQGTTFGVSAFQINFGSTSIDTSGDAPDVLLATLDKGLWGETRPGL